MFYQHKKLQFYLIETREIRKLLNIQTRKCLLFSTPHDPQKPIFNPKLPLMRYFSILKQHCWKVCHGPECSLLNSENDPLRKHKQHKKNTDHVYNLTAEHFMRFIFMRF